MAEFSIYGLGEKLKNLRKQHGFTQQVVADRLGVTRNAYNKYENEGLNPSTEKLIKLAIIFNTTTDYLYGLGKDSYMYLYDFSEEQQRIILDFIDKLNQKFNSAE